MYFPETFQYNIGGFPPKEQETQIGGSLRQREHFLAFFRRNHDIFDSRDPAGILQPLDPPIYPRMRDWDHHNSMASWSQGRARNVFA